MKKLALAAALMGLFGTAQASGLYIDSTGYAAGGNIAISGYNGQPVAQTGVQTSGLLGALYSDTAGTISFTYLGQESDFVNRFRLELIGPAGIINESAAIGTTVSSNIGAGLVQFRFVDTSTTPNTVFENGDTSTSILGIAFLNSASSPYFSYIGFNDTARTDADYDDFVVGVKFSPVPLPAALPLMATALGLFGFGASRRRV